MILNEMAIKLYQTVSNNNEEREYEHWHSSSIYECPRAQYFKRLGMKPLDKPSGAKVLRWTAGHLLEAALRKPISEVWGETNSNHRITNDELDLTGEYDNLTLKDNDSGFRTIIEVKSVSDYAFITKGGQTALKQATDEVNKYGKPVYEAKLTPYLHHELQNHAYVLLLKKEENITVSSIDYVYCSLSGLLCVYHTEVDQNKLKWVIERNKLLNDAWRKQEPPACTCNSEPYLYDLTHKWCDFKSGDNCCNLELLDNFKNKEIEHESINTTNN